jgi:hypothetical protein
MAEIVKGTRTVELSESEWEQVTDPEAIKRYSVEFNLNRYWSDRLDALADKSAEWGDDENPTRFVEKLFQEINATPLGDMMLALLLSELFKARRTLRH